MNLDFMKSRPTLAQASVSRRAEQKGTKIDRAVENKKAALLDARKLAAWSKKVKQLDGWKDRFTGQRVERTIECLPDRAEAHHVEPRANYDTRYDVRNGITLSFATHEKVEHNEIRIVGTKFFVIDGTKYIDARAKVKFTDADGKLLRVG